MTFGTKNTNTTNTNTQPSTPAPAEPTMNIFGEIEKPAAPAAPDTTNEYEVADYGDVWQDTTTQPTNPSPAATNQATTNDSEQFTTYLKQLNFVDGNMQANIKKAFEDQNPELLVNMINESQRAGYQKALVDSHTIMEKKIAEMEKRLTEATNTTMSAREAMNQLHIAVPFTAKPEYEPLTRNVYAQFLRKGDNPSVAVAKTKAFFSKMARDMGYKDTTNKTSGTQRNEDMENSVDARSRGTAIEDIFG